MARGHSHSSWLLILAISAGACNAVPCSQVLPGDGVPSANDTALSDYIRCGPDWVHTKSVPCDTMVVNHFCGTCKMGNPMVDLDVVVDQVRPPMPAITICRTNVHLRLVTGTSGHQSAKSACGRCIGDAEPA